MEQQNKQALHEARKLDAFERLPIPRALAFFMVPTILSQMAALLLNLADAFFIGQTGDPYQVAAMTLTFPVYLCMTCIAIIFGAGGNANLAASLGRGEREKAKRYAAFSVYSAIALVIVYALAVTFFRTPILTALGASRDTMQFCKDYLFWTVLVGSIPLTFNQVISQLFLAEGEGKIAGFGVTMTSVLNIVLDPFFVFPLGMGIAGAALATALSNYVGFAYYLYQWYKRKGNTVVCLDIRRYGIGDKICSRVLAIGVPAGLVPLLTNVCDLVRNHYVVVLGSDIELAGWGSVQKIMFALYTIAMGIAQGARPVVSYNYARRDLRRTRSLIHGTMLTMAIYICAALVLIHLIPELIIKLFVTNEQAVSSAKYFLSTWVFSLIGMCFIEVFNAIFQALGKWKISLANTIINKGLLMTPVLILLANLYGLPSIPFSQIITDSITAVILLVICLRIIRWKESADGSVKIQ